jgi:caffeoyl-CoA O-methyltransferase
MSSRSVAEKGFGQADPGLRAYVDRVFGPEDDALLDIRRRAETAGLPAIQVSRFDGRHLELLARAANIRRAVEIGTLGGYSGLNLLRGMAEEGRLHTFEIEPRHAAVAAETFALNGVSARVVLHLGRALELLPAIEREGPFDLVFIDADKESYPDYLAWAEQHLRVGGLLLGDNAFAFGRLKDPATEDDDSTAALRRFNERLASGGHFRATMLPTEDGLAFGVKVR